MLIELIKNKESGFNRCQCTGYHYNKDIQDLGEWITLDYKTASGNRRLSTSRCVQFSFTYNEYEHGNLQKHYCPKCGMLLYRIIGNY